MSIPMINSKKIADFNQRVSDSVLKIMQKWTDTYKRKNSNYGASWLLTGQTLSLWFPSGVKIDTPRKFIMLGLTVRMLDKLIRAAHLELTSEDDKVGEKSSETFGDLGVYSFMAASAASAVLDEQPFVKVAQMSVNE
jgi:hypothetical protein